MPPLLTLTPTLRRIRRLTRAAQRPMLLRLLAVAPLAPRPPPLPGQRYFLGATAPAAPAAGLTAQTVHGFPAQILQTAPRPTSSL
jgi:hypothetical protein